MQQFFFYLVYFFANYFEIYFASKCNGFGEVIIATVSDLLIKLFLNI